MPTSRARTAICSAPLEWPSRPGFATRIRIRCPSSSETSSTWARTASSSSPSEPWGVPVDPGRAAVVAEGLAQGPRPLARRGAGLGGLDRRRHACWRSRRRRPRRAPRAPRRPPPRRARRFHPSSASIRSRSTSGSGVRIPPSSPVVSRRVLGLGEAVLTDDFDLPALDLRHPLAVRLDQARLHVGDRLDGAAVLLDRRHLGPGALRQLVDEALHHLRALEDVGVVEQVGLVGEDLLDPQAPLLVPGPREAERLVPGGELDRAGAGVAAQGHRQGLEHDARHVVLGLGLGEPERVDLDPVAEAQHLRSVTP